MRHKLIEKYTNLYKNYYELNGPYFGIKHSSIVFLRAKAINDELDLMFPANMLLHFAHTHNLFESFSTNSSYLAAMHVNTCEDDVYVYLSTNQRAMIASACIKHKPNTKYKHNSTFTELCAAAYLPPPTLIDMLEFEVYSMAGNKPILQEHIPRALKNIIDKYGKLENYNDVYRRYYGGRLVEWLKVVESLDDNPYLELAGRLLRDNHMLFAD